MAKRCEVSNAGRALSMVLDIILELRAMCMLCKQDVMRLQSPWGSCIHVEHLMLRNQEPLHGKTPQGTIA